LVDDPKVGWLDDLGGGHEICEDTIFGFEDDLVADYQFINPKKDLVFADSMTSDDDVSG